SGAAPRDLVQRRPAPRRVAPGAPPPPRRIDPGTAVRPARRRPPAVVASAGPVFLDPPASASAAPVRGPAPAGPTGSRPRPALGGLTAVAQTAVAQTAVAQTAVGPRAGRSLKPGSRRGPLTEATVRLPVVPSRG